MGKKPARTKLTGSRNQTIGQLPSKLQERLKEHPRDLAIGLEAAEYCARNNLEARIVSILAPWESVIISEKGSCGDRGLSLLGLGYLASGKLLEAEEIVEKALREYDASPDLKFLRTHVAHALREDARCIQAANEYEELCAGNADQVRTQSLFGSDRHHARVLFWLGEACSETGDTEQAITAFQRSIAIDEASSCAYLGLVRLCMHLDRRDEAIKTLQIGLTRCSDKQELLMFRDYMRERPSISACLIVRNEERLLPECLESIRDWVDEIIIVDTGSTDTTMDIARQYGARIFQQPWSSDFSKHRNYSMDQATGDWLFIIDADERFFLDDVPGIIDQMGEKRFPTFSISVLNVNGNDEKRVTFCNSVRFFRRDLKLRYDGIVHNVLQIPKDVPVLQTRARLKHLGYDLPPEQMKAKFERTLGLLKQQLSNNPDDVFALFNYAELLRGVQPTISPDNAAEIIRAATRVTELVDVTDLDRRHLRLMALNHMTAAHVSLKDWDEALKCCKAALALRPDYLDGLIHLGLVYYGKKDYEGAIAQLQAYLKAQARFDGSRETWPIILSYPDARDLAHNNLGVLYELTGETEKAKQSYLKALEVNPHYRETASRLGRLCLTQSDLENAEKCFHLQLEHHPTLDAMVGLASVYYQSGRYADAESHYRRAIGQYGATSALENDLGNCLFKMARFQDAESCYQRAVELAPTEPLAWRNLAVVQTRLGTCMEAIAAVDKYLDICADDPAALSLAGDLRRISGDCPAAIAYYEQALRLNPAETAALIGLSESYLAMGHKDAAILGYQKLLESDPNNKLVREKLAQISQAAIKV
ncbi:MAG: tetratricopeptide repeat protein [candidate division Zixibacteria bacterium]|nr:tetratricopeptide repeat protein [candidate division Zixibacteria bacterium]